MRITRNSWEGGLNTDISKSKLNPTFYTAAHNLDSVADGDFFALKNIKGTTKVKWFVNPTNTEVLGVFENKWLIGGAYKQCLTVFTAGDNFTPGNPDIFKIWCYDTESNDVYEVYEEEIEDDYLTADRVIDAIGYAENNIDHLYFTDDSEEIRVIRCEIPSPYTENFLTAADISVQRRGGNGNVSLESISAGGSLLSGSYQYAYRMVDPVNKRFTKWSSLSLPFHVYSAANSSGFVYSDYGLPTTFKISLEFKIPNEEVEQFDYFQVAVVENVYPTGPESVVDGDNQTFIASLLPIAAVADYETSPGSTTLNGYEHKANAKVGLIPIEDLVVDYAPIKTAKTLSVKDKKLVVGNIEYRNLESDNPSGAPAIASGSIITRVHASLSDLFSSHDESVYRGYFRDEVYRFGIVYFDKYGNKSPVFVLNLNAVTNNQISGGLGDVRFPSRSTSNSFALFNSSSKLQSLGIRLDLINHPTWAVGFEIVRAKRKKRILAQTPLVPMTYVQGVGAIDSYPSTAVTVAGGSPDNEYATAQPQTSDKVYMPKNLLWPDERVIRRTGGSSGAGTELIKRGEAEIDRTTGASTLAAIFPQNFMYSDGVFTLTGSEKLQTVDYCALRASINTSGGSSNAGDCMDTVVKSTFYALDKGDYYFDPAWVGKSISDESSISGHVTFNNLGPATSLNGKRIMDFAELQTTDVDYGFQPNVHKMVVIDSPTATHDIMPSTSKVFSGAGTKNAVASGVAIFSSNTSLKYESTLTNKYVNEYSGYSDNNSYVQALKIVNLVNDYGDDRYGDVDTQHEFISTGTRYKFSALELVNVAAGAYENVTLDIYGGDCFVSPHTFKVSDGAYSVVNQSKNVGTADTSTTLVTKWGKYFLNTGGAAVALPVGVEAAAQFITVVLESEYNGAIMANEGLVDDGSVNGMPIPMPSGFETLRSPLIYRYNINLSKQNDQKVYFPRPEFHVEKTDFPSRLAYTDQKIYNTDNIGFDIFRVLNFLDLEEKNGEITKLALEGDRLYAIQERGIVSLPVGETQITTTDAGQLSVGTSDFFGRPIVIDNKKGGQHIKGIVETGNAIYIPDHANKAVYVLADNALHSISAGANNETLFRSLFSASTTERNLVGIYDSLRRQYWIADQSYCYIFNEDKKQWVTNYEFPTGALRGGVTANKNLFLIGMEGDQFNAYTMYTGNANTLFDAVVTPRVTFVVNPEDPISKVFTNQAYISTERLATADFTIEREEELDDQTISGTVIAVSPRGGNYRIKLSRAAENERLRGLRLVTTVKWKTANSYSSLSEVLTKYRHESRTPF